MNSKNPDKFIEINQKVKRNNIYTNQGLNDGIQNLNFFSSPRPLSAEEPYLQTRRSSHTFLRSRQRVQKSMKPMKIGKFHPRPQENINLYFNQRAYEEKLNSLSKEKPSHSKYSQKNIYVNKNINTSYGRGNFKGNYQNLFMQYPYKGQQKSKEKEITKDLYTKYKAKSPFRPGGKIRKSLSEENELYHKKVHDPYKPTNEQYLFRSKSPTNKFLSRFHWKPTTQFVKKLLS